MKYLGYFSEAFKLAFKSVKTTIITLIFVGSLFINATLLLWQAGALAIGNALEVATGIVSVVTGLETLNSALEVKNNELKKNNGKIKARNNELKTKNKKLVAKVGRVTDRIAKRTAKVATVNASSMPLESVPNLGIATILSVTTFELYQACETMKDTEELNRLLGNEAKIADTDKVCGLKIPTQEELKAKMQNDLDIIWESQEELFEEMKKHLNPIWESFR